MSKSPADPYLISMGWADAPFGNVSPTVADYFRREIKACAVALGPSSVVAEIGFGNGNFAGWCKTQGVRWIGREANEELRTRARAAGFETIRSQESFAVALGMKSIDLVVAFDVLEHMCIDEIRAFFQECTEVLKSHGKVLLRVPSGDSPFSGAIYYGDLTHRTLLGSRAIRVLASETGLEVSQLREPSLTLGSRWARPVAAVRHLLQRVTYSFLRHVLVLQRDAVLSPNMVAVLSMPAR